MKENINQEINIDNIEEYAYNNTNIAKFTYENYLKCKEKLNLEEETEKYKENYITEDLINKETDIVYKIKNKKVLILIGYQTRIDYSMPYRIMEYQLKIIESAVDKKKIKQKNYKSPTVVSIVLYTGRKKWNVKKYIKGVQESFFQYNGNEIGKYNVVDVNGYTEELLKEKTFLSKAMLIESKR